MISSDAFETQVCEICGMLGYNQWCPMCKTGKGIIKLTIPYAAKLLIQEVSFRLLLGSGSSGGTVERRCGGAGVRGGLTESVFLLGTQLTMQLMGMNIMPRLCMEDTV
jgi:hypothetical protein